MSVRSCVIFNMAFPGFNRAKRSTISRGDWDRDGVSNRADCQPLNWKKQGPEHEKQRTNNFEDLNKLYVHELRYVQHFKKNIKAFGNNEEDLRQLEEHKERASNLKKQIKEL